MPLLTDELGFNQRYLDQLPEDFKEKTQVYLQSIKEQVDKLHVTPAEKQYYLPYGYNLTNEFMGTLPALVYVCELRTSQTVHPILRKIAQKMSQYLIDTHQIKLFVDMSEYAFDIKRGTQDIVMK